MYWSGSLEYCKICPECGEKLKYEHQSYVVGVKTENERSTDSYFIECLNIGYFCPNCPVVVLNEDKFKERVTNAVLFYYPNESSFKFAVGGMINYDAIPEDKRDKELGRDDNPIPLIEFEIVQTSHNNQPQ